MIIDYNAVEWKENPGFKGGEGSFNNKMYDDGTLMETAKEMLKNTGYEEISLISVMLFAFCARASSS